MSRTVPSIRTFRGADHLPQQARPERPEKGAGGFWVVSGAFFGVFGVERGVFRIDGGCKHFELSVDHFGVKE